MTELEPRAPIETIPPINRELVLLDLQRLERVLVPLFEASLASLADMTLPVKVPLLGVVQVPVFAILLPRLSGALQPTISAVLARTLALSDDQLVALVDSLGQELGAWRGILPPVDDWQAVADVLVNSQGGAL